MRVRRTSYARRSLSSKRAGEVEAQFRARSEQLKPRGTPLGLCPACGTLVYVGDSFAITGGQLQHGDCPTGKPPDDVEPA
jgi:hypothetical protein